MWLQWVTRQFETIAGEDREISLQEFKTALNVKEASGAPCSERKNHLALRDTAHHKEGKIIPWASPPLSRIGGRFLSGLPMRVQVHPSGSHGLLGSSKQHVELDICSLPNLKYRWPHIFHQPHGQSRCYDVRKPPSEKYIFQWVCIRESPTPSPVLSHLIRPLPIPGTACILTDWGDIHRGSEPANAHLLPPICGLASAGGLCP